MSTLGDTMSTLGGYHKYIGDVQYIRGISGCMWGISTSGDVQYIGRRSVHRGYHEYIRGYHARGISRVHWAFQ